MLHVCIDFFFELTHIFEFACTFFIQTFPLLKYIVKIVANYFEYQLLNPGILCTPLTEPILNSNHFAVCNSISTSCTMSRTTTMTEPVLSSNHLVVCNSISMACTMSCTLTITGTVIATILNSNHLVGYNSISTSCTMSRTKTITETILNSNQYVVNNVVHKNPQYFMYNKVLIASSSNAYPGTRLG